MLKKDVTWLTMKQISDQTNIRPATINRYKDDFVDYIRFRYNVSSMLEFDGRCIPILTKIYELYRDKNNGRMTTAKVKEALAEFYHEEPLTYDLPGLTITTSPVDQLSTIPDGFIHYLKKQEKRLDLIEKQNSSILNHQQQLMSKQATMEQIMNQHLALLSQIARGRMEERKKTIWQRIFGFSQTTKESDCPG